MPHEPRQNRKKVRDVSKGGGGSPEKRSYDVSRVDKIDIHNKVLCICHYGNNHCKTVISTFMTAKHRPIYLTQMIRGKRHLSLTKLIIQSALIL